MPNSKGDNSILKLLESQINKILKNLKNPVSFEKYIYENLTQAFCFFW